MLTVHPSQKLAMHVSHRAGTGATPGPDIPCNATDLILSELNAGRIPSAQPRNGTQSAIDHNGYAGSRVACQHYVPCLKAKVLDCDPAGYRCCVHGAERISERADCMVKIRSFFTQLAVDNLFCVTFLPPRKGPFMFAQSLDLIAGYAGIIAWIGKSTHISDTVLHIHAGMAILLAIRVISGKSLASFVPFAFVVAAQLGNEFMDRLYHGSWRWPDTIDDMIATLFWPFLISTVVRLRSPLVNRTRRGENLEGG